MACSRLAGSDDEGESWDMNPAAGCGVTGHDHQKTTSGPPAAGVEAQYPCVLYHNSFRPGLEVEALDDVNEGTVVALS